MRIRHGTLLRDGLVGQVPDVGEAVLDVAKGNEHLLAICGYSFRVGGLGLPVTCQVAATGKDRQ